MLLRTLRSTRRCWVLLVLAGTVYAADVAIRPEQLPSPDPGHSSAWPKSCDDLSGGPITIRPTWSEVWQALDRSAGCTQNCHVGTQPAAELDLSSAVQSQYLLVLQPSAQLPALTRVVPGNARASLLFQKLNCHWQVVGRRMPASGPLPLGVQALVYDWIEQGAYGEPAEDPIVRDYVFEDSLELLRR
jgi:hypothetical protein